MGFINIAHWSTEQIRDFKIMEINKSFTKKVHLVLVGIDGNAFNLLGKFTNAVRAANWTSEEVNFVLWKATSGDYNRLLSTLMEHSDDPYGEKSGDVVYINGET